MKEAKIYPLFSKPIYVNNVDYDMTKIYPALEKVKWRNIHISQDEKFAWSSIDNFILRNKKFKKIKEIIIEHFNNYVYNVLEWNQKFELTTSWLTKTGYLEKARYHNHNNCMYSGVLYLKVPSEKATISFENYATQRFNIDPKQYNMFNNLEFFIDANAGDIVIFPSEVFHKINKNYTHEDRISLAFNFIPVGPIGNPKLDSYCEIQVK
jgi:uncharacterized protein (TIGR02466 family)